MPRLPLAFIFARASTSARVLAPSIPLPRPSTSLSLTASFRTLSVSSSPFTTLRIARQNTIPFPRLQQVRCVTYGCEYQPSQRKRKRKHGFLSRTKGDRNAYKMLIRRRAKGRRFLSH